MSHNLETLANGKTAFADSRTDAWHKLGQSGQGVMTAQEMLKQAYLAGWNVRKTPLQTVATVEVGSGHVGAAEMSFTLEVVRNFASVRTNPVTGMPEVLGVVGNSYQPIQNEEHADLLDAIVDEGGAHFETAGSLNGGKQTFITMKVPSFMDFGGKDPHELYLSALNSHDGSSSFRLIVTPIRIVCANTQAAALSAAKASFGVRHTRGAKNTIQQARQALGLTFKYAEEFEAEMTKLLNESMTPRQFGSFADKLWTPPKADESRTILTRHGERRDLVMDLFKSSPTLKDVKGTRYAAYNAITEYLDHFSPTPSTAKDAEAVRALRTLTSEPVRKTKERAFALLKV